MIAARIMILLTLKDGILFRTKQFVPDYRYTQSFLGTESVDEVVIVDVGEDREAFYKSAREYCDKCFSPVTIGGKIKDLDEVSYLFREVGADKVLVKGSNLYLLSKIAKKWGNQAIVAGVDYPSAGNIGNFPVADAIEAEGHGAGEILLTSIDRDGSLQGYDLPTLKAVSRRVSIPVVVSGGCGGAHHMKEAFDAGASGACTSVIHHFTDISLKAAKLRLSNQGVRVRQ